MGRKKWRVELIHNKKRYLGGLFDNEEQAAIKVNLMCDELEMDRKNPMIKMELGSIEKVPNKTSIYTGVSWYKDRNKWRVDLIHNKKRYSGGLFDNEEQAAMKVNLMCDELEMDRKNPMINIRTNAIQQKTKSKAPQYATENTVDEDVKIEDEKILDGFKDACENRFIYQSNDEESCIDTASRKGQKRKRKEEPMMNDVEVEIATPNHDQNELLEKI